MKEARHKTTHSMIALIKLNKMSTIYSDRKQISGGLKARYGG